MSNAHLLKLLSAGDPQSLDEVLIQVRRGALDKVSVSRALATSLFRTTHGDASPLLAVLVERGVSLRQWMETRAQEAPPAPLIELFVSLLHSMGTHRERASWRWP